MRVLLVALVVVLLTACGGPDERTAPNGITYNTQDVAYAQDTFQHSAGALLLVDLLKGRSTSPELRQVAEEIFVRTYQDGGTVTEWLTQWDEPVPPSALKHDETGAPHTHDPAELLEAAGDDAGKDLPGMPTAALLRALAEKQGAGFEEAWADAMVAHQQGALELAAKEVDAGLFSPVVDLAEAGTKLRTDWIDALEELAG